jgi:hypothetical protein
MCHSSKESRAICQSCVKGLGSSRRRARPSARMKQVGMEPQIPHLHQLRVPHADLPWTSRGFSSHFPTSHLHTYTPTHLQYHIRAADVVVTSMQAAAASNAPIPRPARRQATWASQLAAGRDGTGREELRFMSPGLCGQAPGEILASILAPSVLGFDAWPALSQASRRATSTHNYTKLSSGRCDGGGGVRQHVTQGWMQLHLHT